MNFLPDSNILINLFKGRQPDGTFLKNLISEGKLHLSVISIAEVLVGASSQEKSDLKELCDISEVVNVDQKIAEIAAAYRQQFSRKTRKVYLLDCLIAASCRVFDLTLVTQNVSDYPMKDIRIVKPK